MNPHNKPPVLEQISAEMRKIISYQQDNLPPIPDDDDLAAQRRYYQIERQFWNADAPDMPVTECIVPTSYGQVGARLYYPQSANRATLFYLHGGGFILGDLNTHDRIMRLLARYTGCTVIGIDYTLSPEARFPQAIEETVAACEYFHTHASQYRLTMDKIGFAGDSAGAMLALATALWLRDHDLQYGQVAGVLLWYGLYGLQDSPSRRLLGGSWDGLTRQDLERYELSYLRNTQDRESPYYCLFNNCLTDNVPPCFIASAEFDPLLDDSRLLHLTLQAHQQPCHYASYPGTLHAFLHYSRMMKIADDALRDGAHYFLQQLN